jgi:hypothetical protein
MDPQDVQERARAFCEALMAGDVTLASADLSRELQANLGPLVAILPLPLTEATVGSVEVGGSGYVAILRLVGETSEIELQTRWKDRDGRPTIVEASHVVLATAQEPAPEPDNET